jgi:ABC-type microcin C transport system permease subunit YejE
MKDFSSVLRKLAKTDYYQALYSSAKELGLQIFENNTDLTKIQLWFLSYMGMYSSINMDIAIGEISERVLENEIYEDAYLIYKKKQFSKDMKNKFQKTEVPNSPAKSQWVFRKTKVK